jgi:hypothetical protein
MLRSYPQVYSLGHKAIADLLLGPVVVQEKVDGSQFSFGLIDGTVYMRSKGADISPESPDKLFSAARETAMGLATAGLLAEGYTYRGEVLSKPRHNTLCYSRVPRGNIVLFDVDSGLEDYAPPDILAAVGEHIGLEVVPTLYSGELTALSQLEELLARESFLGGTKIEGVVIKNYARFGIDKKVLMGKLVSEAFKEVHGADWHARNPHGKDVVAGIIESLRVEARWAKAVQHSREAGTLTESAKDIGPLIQSVIADVLREEGAEIREILFDHFWREISRGLPRGLPEWYKRQLAAQQFEKEVETPNSQLNSALEHEGKE